MSRTFKVRIEIGESEHFHGALVELDTTIDDDLELSASDALKAATDYVDGEFVKQNPDWDEEDEDEDDEEVEFSPGRTYTLKEILNTPGLVCGNRENYWKRHGQQLIDALFTSRGRSVTLKNLAYSMIPPVDAPIAGDDNVEVREDLSYLALRLAAKEKGVTPYDKPYGISAHPVGDGEPDWGRVCELIDEEAQ